jgi:hypothetical protein
MHMLLIENNIGRMRTDRSMIGLRWGIGLGMNLFLSISGYPCFILEFAFGFSPRARIVFSNSLVP